MKKLTIFLFSLLVISFGFCSSAYGATNATVKVDTKIQASDVQAKAGVADILDLIDRTNVQIQGLIDEAMLKTSEITSKEASHLNELESERAILQADSKRLEENPEELTKITEEINYCKQEANYAIINIMEELIRVTDKIANDMVIEAAKYGIIVIKEYIPITVDGVTYMVDPLHVAWDLFSNYKIVNAIIYI